MASKRFLVVLGLLLIVAMLAAACGTTEPTAEPQQATDQPAEDTTGKKVGFSVYDMQYGFFQDMEAGTREAAEAAGYEYVLVDQKSSESTMVASTMDLLNQGVDALIISPFKPDAMGPIVDAAKEKGIPVVINDIGGGGTNYDVIVISDNYNGGVMAAEEMDRLITESGKPKKVASITCEPSAVYAARRNEGYEAKMQEMGYEVVATLSGNSRMEEGYKVMQDILSANPDVAGVFSCNDPMAVGAAQAIADAGKSGSTDVFVIGFNADEIALEAIKAGTMAATIQQVPYEMGKMTVDLATQLMNGEALTYDNEGEREIYVPVNLITPDNVGDLLGDQPAEDMTGKKVGFSVYDMQYGFFQDM
ncbi:MAG: substrate-binding domain-containing protein, partial [Anaerolineae bacterium]|nr:substrate-binding domain-containing protein [Anaerolineae bacterium]